MKLLIEIRNSSHPIRKDSRPAPALPDRTLANRSTGQASELPGSVRRSQGIRAAASKMTIAPSSTVALHSWWD
jgi:hypothetical protein